MYSTVHAVDVGVTRYVILTSCQYAREDILKEQLTRPELWFLG